ncbi:signal peptide peptidase-domain-containing protein [Xylariaceae sp. FL0016]|nr:signal peptide peptidase-domain-containing protein [Xylariaceae sp. FL0016]
MATNNSTFLASSEISATNLTAAPVANLTFSEKLATVPTKLFENPGLLLLEARIVFSSLACIYLASHAALRRPPSARLRKTKSKDGRKVDEKEDEFYVQGLLPSDAILFPVLAGTVLVGLYYLIKWLEDPEILNRILKAYTSTTSLASLGKFSADGLQFITNLIFPTVWRSSDGRLYHIDAEKAIQWYNPDDSTEQICDVNKKTPLPGWWSEWKLSDARTKMIWDVRRLLLKPWTVRLSVYGIGKENFKIRLNYILGVILAIGASLVYQFVDSALLSNVMGFAFSYYAIMLMSPTTFATGTSLLFGLFFYDIYMVFYTPYMVTVATKLDIPVKLTFQGPKGASMLGLGDIVLPGIFIAICLRFDNYLYYHRQIKHVPVDLKTEDQSTGRSNSKKKQVMVVKPEYIDPREQWGDRFWGTKLSKFLSPDATPALKASTFPKTYFHAAMFGYLIAMVTTLAMLLAFQHAQPALLYLVPGVVMAVWLTGAIRGDLSLIWAYTEDGSLDKVDVLQEVDGNGNVIEEIGDGEKTSKQNDQNEGDPLPNTTEKGTISDTSAQQTLNKKTPSNPPVFFLSVEAPVQNS